MGARLTRRSFGALAGATILHAASPARAETDTVRIPQGAGGIGFLPLLVMEKKGLVEQKAQEMGFKLGVEWLRLGGPSMVNDLLISGQADFAAAGPPAMITIWARTMGNAGVKGVCGMTSIPMYLNTRSPTLNALHDLGPNDKIAVTAVKVSIPAIILQMAAVKEFGPSEYTRYDQYTVSMTHPDGVAALLSGTEITSHFTSPPFYQRERKAPNIRRIMTSDDVMGRIDHVHPALHHGQVPRRQSEGLCGGARGAQGRDRLHQRRQACGRRDLPAIERCEGLEARGNP